MLPRFQSAFSVVDHPLNTSDHHPILAIFQHHLPAPPVPSCSKTHKLPNWKGTSEGEIHQLYTTPVKTSLLSLLQDLPSESNLSKDPSLIDHHVTVLTSILLHNSQHIPSRSFHPHRSPGWDSSLKAAQCECKLRYRS